MAMLLVIDDHAEIRRMIKLMLEPLGYGVVEAENGETGIALYRQQRFDLTLLDMFMPDKDGLETLRDLRQIDPGIRVIAMSGGGTHGFVGVLKSASLLGAVKTLFKPFSQQQLREAVQGVLEAGRPDEGQGQRFQLIKSSS